MFKWLRFFKSVDSITPQEAKALMASEQAWALVDVRQPEEFAERAVPGACLIPLSELGRRCEELNREDTVLLYCRSGGRSKLAARILAVKGFEKVKNVSGGILAWE